MKAANPMIFGLLWPVVVCFYVIILHQLGAPGWIWAAVAVLLVIIAAYVIFKKM